MLATNAFFFSGPPARDSKKTSRRRKCRQLARILHRRGNLRRPSAEIPQSPTATATAKYLCAEIFDTSTKPSETGVELKVRSHWLDNEVRTLYFLHVAVAAGRPAPAVAWPSLDAPQNPVANVDDVMFCSTMMSLQSAISTSLQPMFHRRKHRDTGERHPSGRLRRHQCPRARRHELRRHQFHVTGTIAILKPTSRSAFSSGVFYRRRTSPSLRGTSIVTASRYTCFPAAIVPPTGVHEEGGVAMINRVHFC